MFKASDVKELREKTGAGMMDCKKALEACDGNQDKAADWLREKGIAKAAKKESRIAAEGITEADVNGNEAIIFEVNVLNIKDGSETVGDKLVALTAKIGEKLSFRRFEKIEKNDDEVFGTYKHMGGKIGTIVIVKGANEEVAKDVAMQAAAMNPIALKRDEVPSELVEKEKHFIEEEVKQQSAGKPDAVIQKMVAGKLEKYYKEVVLVEQAFIKENKLSVEKYVKDNGGEVISMTRFAVGEGIEKRVENFAEEVMSQING